MLSFSWAVASPGEIRNEQTKETACIKSFGDELEKVRLRESGLTCLSRERNESNAIVDEVHATT